MLEKIMLKTDNVQDYFTTRNGVYMLGDARKILKDMYSGIVDAVITDPPWGVYSNDEYDNAQAYYDVLSLLYRVMRRNAWLIVYYSVKSLNKIFYETEKHGFKYRWTIARINMSKQVWSPVGKNSWSPIIVFSKNTPSTKYKLIDVFIGAELPDIRIKNKKVYMLFKDTSIIASLLQMFTDRGEVVLDPFAGYGSIPLTCELFRRRWIAIEIDREKYEYAKKLFREYFGSAWCLSVSE